jgi:hypothetical protein
MGPRAVWPSAEDLASAGIRSPNSSASNQKLRRLNYCGSLVYPEGERVILGCAIPVVLSQKYNV